MSEARQVNIVQGTQAWHDWRKNGVGASDVPALFGKSPYKTARDLWFEKAGLGEPDDEDRSYIFARGHESEAELRAALSKHTKIEINPTCFEKDEIFLVSLDGYERSIGILEAKLVSKSVLKRALTLGELPEHHWIQMQAQFHGSDTDRGFYGAKAPGVKDIAMVEVSRDEKFITLIRRAVEEFWKALAKSLMPALSDQDTFFVTDPTQIELFEKLQQLKAQKDRADAQYEAIEAQVKGISTHPRIRCGVVSVTEATRTGSIDFLKIPEVKALKEEYLASFRKRSSTYKTIRFQKG